MCPSGSHLCISYWACLLAPIKKLPDYVWSVIPVLREHWDGKAANERVVTIYLIRDQKKVEAFMMIQEPSVGQAHAQDGPHNQPVLCSSFSTWTLSPPRGPGHYQVKPLGSALQLVQGQCHPCPHPCPQRHQTPLCSVCCSSLVQPLCHQPFLDTPLSSERAILHNPSRPPFRGPSTSGLLSTTSTSRLTSAWRIFCFACSTAALSFWM